jgi:hypothetical protein
MIPDVCDIKKRKKKKDLVDYDVRITIMYKTIETREKKR